MKQGIFFDIFPKKHERIKVEKEKPKIIADYREKNCLVFSELIKLGCDVEFKELKVADYIINNVAIERKTASDFISSMINRRLLNQLEELQQYENRILIIEGADELDMYNDEKEGVHPNSIRGFILSIILKYKVPIVYTKNSEDTAKFISVLARKKEKETPLNAVKKSLSQKEQMQFIIESFQGIGPKTAKKLLEKFKTIKNILNATQEELKNEIGKKAEIFRIIEENY